MERLEKFTIGSGNFPEWFNKELTKGRGHINTDPDTGMVTGVTIFTVAGTLKGKNGDVVLKTRNGMTVIPASKAKTYL